MDQPFQILAWLALLMLAVVSAQVVVNQYRLFRAAQSTAALERDYLRERIGQIADQRRFEREKSEASWNGFRKFRIVEKVAETSDIISFHLAPHDGKPLPPFLPGQYVTFQLNVAGQPRPVVRCYSLSERPGVPDRYRVTIKRVPGGIGSNHFHDTLKVGDIVDMKAPAGGFCLDLQRRAPVVLVGGGVGLTPLLSMLNAITATDSEREVWLFFGVRNGSEHLMRDHLRSVAEKHPNLHLHVCYSQPSPEDLAVAPHAFQHTGRVSVDLLKHELPERPFEYYLCGPPAMMNGLVADLKTWGVPENRVFNEAFGASTVRAPALQTNSTTTLALKIQFGRSGKTCAWNAETGSLLDFALKNGVAIDSGCRAGNCGTCLIAIKSGEVTHLREPGVTVEKGSCLACISVPKTALVLDA